MAVKKDTSKIKQIAEALGLSPATVSVVLNGRGDSIRISKKTQQKVWNEAKKVGYSPNIYARRLRMGASVQPTYVIAAFWNVTYYVDEMLGTLTREIMQKEEELGISIELVIQPYMEGRLSEEGQKINANRYSGAIIFGASNKDLDFLAGQTFNIPVILCNREIAGFNSVMNADYHAGELCAEHFSGRGLKTAGVIGADSSNRAAAERCRGFLSKCKELGIKVNKRMVIEENARTTSAGYTAMTKFLSGKTYPDGLFLLYDTAAAGVLQAIRGHGIRVPDDMEIVAYGDTVVLHYLSPTITSLRVSTSVLMESMIDILIRHLKDEKTNAEAVREEPQFVYRQSSPAPDNQVSE